MATPGWTAIGNYNVIEVEVSETGDSIRSKANPKYHFWRSGVNTDGTQVAAAAVPPPTNELRVFGTPPCNHGPVVTEFTMGRYLLEPPPALGKGVSRGSSWVFAVGRRRGGGGGVCRLRSPGEVNKGQRTVDRGQGLARSAQCTAYSAQHAARRETPKAR
jgi:hypothetical protein